ncbi:retrovirus-related pol polyprotein from transposon TNT 1-94 [Tanacetum coccineum]
MLSRFVFSKQYWTKAVATVCYTQNRSTIVKRHVKTPYEIFCGRLPNISFLHIFGCSFYIHNHKDHLGKFDEKADDGYFLGYTLIYKAFRVFNTRRQQIKDLFHITFHESTEAIKFSKPSVDNITIAESERYLPDEYLHHFEPSQRYQVENHVVQFIKPYDRPEPIVNEVVASLDLNDQADQNDHPVETDQILNDDQTKHSNHTNNEHIIDNLTNSEYVQDTEPLSSLIKDTSASNAVLTIQTITSSSIPSLATLALQDRWSRDKHIELVNIVGNLRAGVLTRAIDKELSATSAHEYLFVDFLFEKEPKKVSEALKHPRWVDAM